MSRQNSKARPKLARSSRDSQWVVRIEIGNADLVPWLNRVGGSYFLDFDAVILEVITRVAKVASIACVR